MGEIWEDKTRFTHLAEVETAVLRAKVKLGELKVKVPEDLVASLKIDVKEIERIERETGHDVIAFLIHTTPQLPKELQLYWHEDMTSYDPQDTGLSLQLVSSIELIWEKMLYLMKAIKNRAFEHKYTLQIGRTHGVHAEPITFGVELANWYDEFKRHIIRLKQLKELVSVGKISGAVGMFTLDPAIEEIACNSLGLKPIIASQIISRDIIAEYLAKIAIIGGTIEKIAVNIRTLQRTEILEAQEYFSPTQRGSSAMPHKKNPIGSENLSGLARVLRGYALTAMEDQNTWDQRDIANSGPERIILPDASILLDYMLARLTGIIEKWIIYPEKMEENLKITKGLIFSQDVQSLMARKSGLPKKEAYKIVQDVAFKCWDKRTGFLEELLQDEKIMKYLSGGELRSCFNIKAKVKHTDYIFKKVFRKEE